ncbi:hypothetical protein [Bradyrhizobium sp. STM 3557]
MIERDAHSGRLDALAEEPSRRIAQAARASCEALRIAEVLDRL